MSLRETIGYTFVRTLIRAAMLLLTRTAVRGAEHLPASGPGIVVCNHIAAVDPGILVGALSRPIVLMSKVENRRGPLKLFMPMVGAFTVRRGTADRRALDQAERVLRAGRLLCLFPEGTRSRDGALGPAHGGAALLAAKAAVPIIPVALTGTPRIFSRRFPWLGFPHVTVTIGASFAATPGGTSAGQTRRAERDRLTGTIMAQIAALLPPEQRGSYADSTLGGRPCSAS
jgi:1-acyl-sn-glycerol-3-phosphate acyltransferase